MLMLQQNMHQNYQAFTKTQQSFQVVLVVASLNQNTRTHKDESSRISDFRPCGERVRGHQALPEQSSTGLKGETENKAPGLCEELSTVKTQCLKGRILAATRGDTHPGTQQEPDKGAQCNLGDPFSEGNLRENSPHTPASHC